MITKRKQMGGGEDIVYPSLTLMYHLWKTLKGTHLLSLKSAMKISLNRRYSLSPNLMLLHPKTPPVLAMSPIWVQPILIQIMPLMMEKGAR